MDNIVYYYVLIKLQSKIRIYIKTVVKHCLKMGTLSEKCTLRESNHYVIITDIRNTNYND